jgi:hypothetical protein
MTPLLGPLHKSMKGPQQLGWDLMYKVRNSFWALLGFEGPASWGQIAQGCWAWKVRTSRKFVPHLLLKAFAKLRSFGEWGSKDFILPSDLSSKCNCYKGLTTCPLIILSLFLIKLPNTTRRPPPTTCCCHMNFRDYPSLPTHNEAILFTNAQRFEVCLLYHYTYMVRCAHPTAS